MVDEKRHKSGQITLPMTLAVLLIATASLGLWGILRHWRQLAQTQLRIDRCAGEAALELRDTLDSLEAANQRIEAIRLALLPAELVPGAGVGLRVALTAQVALQDLTRVKWEANRLSWLARRRCLQQNDLPNPLPAMEWSRDPPDEFGQKPLSWDGEQPSEFRIAVFHPPRAAGARVFRTKKKEIPVEKKGWNVEWY